MLSSSKKGIDYSKWDHIECSDNDDEEEEDEAPLSLHPKTNKNPRVTRFDAPRRVTTQNDGTLFIESSCKVEESLVENQTVSKKEEPSCRIDEKAVIDKKQLEWTTQGGRTTTPGETGELDLYWTQDRHDAIIRIQLPSYISSKDVSVNISGTVLTYEDRNSAAGDQRATVVVTSKTKVLLSSTLVYPVHYSQDDNEDDVDWSIDYLGSERFVVIILHKAAPMHGVTLWWRRPLADMEEVEIDRGSNQKEQGKKFQQAWEEAHRQFLAKIESGELPRMNTKMDPRDHHH